MGFWAKVYSGCVANAHFVLPLGGFVLFGLLSTFIHWTIVALLFGGGIYAFNSYKPNKPKVIPVDEAQIRSSADELIAQEQREKRERAAALRKKLNSKASGNSSAEESSRAETPTASTTTTTTTTRGNKRNKQAEEDDDDIDPALMSNFALGRPTSGKARTVAAAATAPTAATTASKASAKATGRGGAVSGTESGKDTKATRVTSGGASGSDNAPRNRRGVQADGWTST